MGPDREAAGRRRRPSIRPARGPSSRAATSCSIAASPRRVKINKKGVDFPFDGGTADITSRYCCSSFGWDLPRVKRTGNGGAVRDADRGRRPGDRQLREPGPEQVPLPHVGDRLLGRPGADRGPRQRRDRLGLARQQPHRRRRADGHPPDDRQPRRVRHRVGRRRPERARRAAPDDPRSRRDQDRRSSATTRSRRSIGPARNSRGARRCRPRSSPQDVQKARDAGAEVVIVFPHWGTEYDPTPFKGQQALARAAIDGGADIVIGNHAHWAGRHGGLRGQADLVRARQLRLRPDVVGADDGRGSPSS